MKIFCLTGFLILSFCGTSFSDEYLYICEKKNLPKKIDGIGVENLSDKKNSTYRVIQSLSGMSTDYIQIESKAPLSIPGFTLQKVTKFRRVGEGTEVEVKEYNETPKGFHKDWSKVEVSSK